MYYHQITTFILKHYQVVKLIITFMLQVIDSVERASYNITQSRSELYEISSANVLAVFVDINSVNLPDNIQNTILIKFMNDDDYEIFVTGFQPSCMFSLCTICIFCSTLQYEVLCLVSVFCLN